MEINLPLLPPGFPPGHAAFYVGQSDIDRNSSVITQKNKSLYNSTGQWVVVRLQIHEGVSRMSHDFRRVLNLPVWVAEACCAIAWVSKKSSSQEHELVNTCTGALHWHKTSEAVEVRNLSEKQLLIDEPLMTALFHFLFVYPTFQHSPARLCRSLWWKGRHNRRGSKS